MDNSPIETGGMPPVSQQTGEESPTGILQAMTSFLIPGAVLISPLQDFTLYLTRREKIHGARKSLSALNGQEPCSMSIDESDSIMGEEDLLKKENVRILRPKKRLGTKTPERESPSSSASDVDNLNNQAAVDKFTLLRGTGTYVAGNQVISARHRSNFIRLLDFSDGNNFLCGVTMDHNYHVILQTQDVNYAMEASRKCQSAFAAANMIMEEARNGVCITSMKRVTDLSFQDVDELVGLVWTVTKATSCAHLGGARD